MEINVFDVLGITGSGLIGYFYFFAQYRQSFLNSTTFFVGNIFGSLLILSSLFFSSFNLASFLIESLWVSVSIYGLTKYNILNNLTDEDVSYSIDELSINNFPSTVEHRQFSKNDLGVDIKFKDINGEYIPKKSGFVKNFLFNGTTMLTPNAIMNTDLNINSLDLISYTDDMDVFFVILEENKDYTLEEIKIKIPVKKWLSESLTKERRAIFIKTGFMENNEKFINEDGTVKDDIFLAPKPGLTQEAAEYLANLKDLDAIIIDSISFESNGEKKEAMTVASILMNVREEVFIPLVYQAKTPTKDNYNHIFIGFGNTPKKSILPGYSIQLILY